MDARVEVSFPISDRFSGARAVKVTGKGGYMLVVPEPDKMKNFVIGLKAGTSAPIVGESVGQEAKVASAPSKAGASDDEYVSVKEAAEIFKCSDKTIRNYYGDGRLKY